MRPLSAPELLDAWEDGMVEGPVERALLLLATACPEISREDLSALPIGQRDDRLLTLREWTFGSAFNSTVACPRCGEKVELSFDASSVRASPEPADTLGELTVEVAGFDLRVRAPNSADMAAAVAGDNVESMRRQLFERCLVSTLRNGQPAAPQQLPPEAIEAVAGCLAQADPQADIQLALTCPSCGHSWSAVFDIAAFFWNEIEAWACRVLREVHLLAVAYGWSELDILQLSPLRRQAYLEMLDA